MKRKQIPVDLDTLVSFVIQSGRVLEGGVISMLCDIYYMDSKVDTHTIVKWRIQM